jgi:hypothetical protein
MRLFFKDLSHRDFTIYQRQSEIIRDLERLNEELYSLRKIVSISDWISSTWICLDHAVSSINALSKPEVVCVYFSESQPKFWMWSGERRPFHRGNSNCCSINFYGSGSYPAHSADCTIHRNSTNQPEDHLEDDQGRCNPGAFY